MPIEPKTSITNTAYQILAQINQNHVKTFTEDGRAPIENLYAAYLKLLEPGHWEVEIIAEAATTWQGKPVDFPILAFKTKITGPALYILSGIHGEEPTGPNAIADSLDVLTEMGKNRPVVLIPLCNPLGYFRKWRYLNKEQYSDQPEVEGMSVGDSEHLLLTADKTAVRRPKPANDTCDALSNFILQTSQNYPPEISVDFHGDILIPNGYVYSQGQAGAKDFLADQFIRIFEQNHIPIQKDGQTRFGEPIIDGKTGRQQDGSIDELLSADKIMVDGRIIPGPNAPHVFVLETPDADLPIETRKQAYKAVLKFLSTL